MTDPIRDAAAPGAPGGIRPAEGIRAGAAAAPASASTDAAFQALLEQLERKSADLAREAQAVSGPADLSRAVEGARSALEDALSIQARLLEATQQARHQFKEPGTVKPRGLKP